MTGAKALAQSRLPPTSKAAVDIRLAPVPEIKAREAACIQVVIFLFPYGSADMPTQFSSDHPRKPYARDAGGTGICAVPLARLASPLRWVRWAVAVMWLVTGIVSLGFYPVTDSYALLARAGVPPMLAPLALYGAALLDIVLGLLCLLPWYRRYIWLAQASLILFYTAVISLRLPEFWLHPYGPILKNLPLLATLWLLYRVEQELARCRNGS